MFHRELGMNFRDWRQLVQSSYALAHLAQGEPVKVIASRLGYTASAFSVMIRRNLRYAPTLFWRKAKRPKTLPPRKLWSRVPN
jgi:methylphosphotriester-DNA--protein-cysteine methyltransferase